MIPRPGTPIPLLDWLVVLAVSVLVVYAVALFFTDARTNAGYPVVPATASTAGAAR